MSLSQDFGGEIFFFANHSVKLEFLFFKPKKKKLLRL